MDGSHDYTSLREAQRESWHERHAELDARTCEMVEQSLTAIARSRALLKTTRRQLERHRPGGPQPPAMER
jgi:transposase